jgi:hypothetical protein
MANPESVPEPSKKKQSSSVRHTRAIQRDRSKRPLSAPPDEQVTERLTELVHPATLAQVDYFRQLGLRERVFTLPLMVAIVLTMIWRQIGEVTQVVRLMQTESLFWAQPRRITQQALSLRLGSLPAELFWKVLAAVLPVMQTRFQARQRPLSPEVTWARVHYTHVLVQDGSTLDALLRKVGLLRDHPVNPLAGRITALLDLCSHLPYHLWYEEAAEAHDQRFWERILEVLQADTLLIFDLGYTNFTVFVQLTAAKVTFLTRAKKNLSYQIDRTLQRAATLHESIVWIGQGETRQHVRLIEVLYRGAWYRYLTNELEPARLPALDAIALYGQRWRIEDAFNVVKRLLGLAYFWSGSLNSVALQVWATWLLYAVLVDLTDAVADELKQPFAAVSLEMVYRSLYFFTQAHHRGEATDVVKYLAANASWLGIVKRKRQSAQRRNLDLTNSVSP